MPEPVSELAIPKKTGGVNGKASTKARASSVKVRYTAGVYAAPAILPQEFSDAIKSLEAALDNDIWLLIQNSPEQKFETLDDRIIEVLLDSKHSASGNRGVCLLLDSPGGYTGPHISDQAIS